MSAKKLKVRKEFKDPSFKNIHLEKIIIELVFETDSKTETETTEKLVK